MNGKDQKNNFSYNLISWHKNNGRHNLTHIKMNVSVIKTKSINNITIDKYYWKNIYDNIASSKPVKSVIIKLTEELS